MMLIDCPHCGLRDETEFEYGSQAHVPYPKDPTALTNEQWAQWLYFRDNPMGERAERWVHLQGCRKWFNAIRDTVTYEFKTTYPVSTPRPDTSTPQEGSR